MLFKILAKKKRNYFYLFLISTLLININPVYAYAGPGAAIGAILVFLTVIVAFFASTFIKIFSFLKNLLKKSSNPKKKKTKK